MGVEWNVGGAFRRNSSALSLLILAFFILMVSSTVYFALALDRAQFESMEEVKNYDNRLKDISGLDGWGLTKFYWSNNMQVAGIYAVATPIYFGPNSVMATGYQIGMALIYNYHRYGSGIIPAFAGQIFVHGILELTGVFIMAAASLRLAWKFWQGFGSMISGGFKRLSRRRRVLIKQHAADYILLFALGVSMILLAAPIEAYVSPVFGLIFLLFPVVAYIYLAVVMLFYYSIFRLGSAPMRRALASVWGDLRAVPERNWKPSLLSVLVLVISTILMWIGLVFQ